MAETLAASPEQHDGLQHTAPAGVARLSQFLHDTRQEMHKVETPTRDEVQSTTLIVIATVFLFAAFFEVVDLVIGNGIDKLFLKLTHH